MHKPFCRMLIPFIIMLVSLPSWALSIGEITLNSKLGQPLSAQLPLGDLGELETEQIIVRHASLETYDKLKIEQPTAFQAIHFKTVTHNNHGSIKLSTKAAVNEPYIRLLVHIRWPQGEMLKEITLLLDPS